ncbi:MAG: 16S rRNA (adenine(1518)-N(6)/adenine(1519)-N(6))-dimethyltransferase RsmA [Lachnospiraceae bacterium]|nr:16S rRNA (adenine(1518)-N(6)/adenine(1519)-N(6))-dimethyltransferase RsmA [Lachnospiraceae bacterium]
MQSIYSDSDSVPAEGRPARIISRTKEIVTGSGFRFQKKFGQNFLIDPHVLAKITAASRLTPETAVIEVGPGIGTLTQELCEGAGRVIAVEIDRNLVEILHQTLAGYPNLTIISSDILEIDPQELHKMCGPFTEVSMIANLPYNITSPLVMKYLEEAPFVSSMVLMLQEEVARRMQAAPGTKEYGSLSVAVQYYAEAEIAAYVPMNCFYPRPKVGSCVIRLTRREKPAVGVKDETLFFKVVRAAFNQRRKTVVNSLSNGLAEEFTKEQVRAALESAGVGEKQRGEELGLSEFAMIANYLYNI